MSAFVVSKKHLDALLTFANLHNEKFYQRNCGLPRDFHASVIKDLSELGSILMTANVESVNARYQETEDAAPYVFAFERNHSAVQILKACKCFDYQSCEIDGYEATPAAKIIDQIRDTAIRVLPGYEDAKWEVA